MAKKAKKLSKFIIFLIVCGAVIGSIIITVLGFEIAFLISDANITCWRPDYAKIDLTQILDKPQLSEEDYEILYAQTGLSKIGIDRALSRGSNGKERIKKIQKDFFAEHTITKDKFAPFMCTDRIEKNVAHVYLEDGDIVVTSSTHLASCRIGHAGLVTNGERGKVLQATEYGTLSKIGNFDYYTCRVNFIILTPKTDKETKSKVADYAVNNLLGIPYDITAGVLTDKNSIEKTQCAHLVWYAYKQFGIDIDGNGGLAVSPWNIANSDQLEVVQTFGFDPEILWRRLNY